MGLRSPKNHTAPRLQPLNLVFIFNGFIQQTLAECLTGGASIAPSLLEQ